MDASGTVETMTCGRLAVVVVAFHLVLATSFCNFAPLAKVRVTNESGEELTDVGIQGRGFSERLDILGPGQTVEFRVSPRGESGVAISFTARGRRFSTAENGYVENAPGYLVLVKIRGDLTVSVDTTIAD
jgi:YD repeat-containing protein